MRKIVTTIGLLGLVAMAGCDFGAPPKTLTITGVVVDTVSGAPLRATMTVAFGFCQITCQYTGSAGLASTDSATGRYTLLINGPSDPKTCEGFEYYVFANAGANYSTATTAIPCGVLNDTLNFSLHPAKAYTVLGRVTLSPNGIAAQNVQITVGLYPTGSTCLASGACQSSSIATARTSGTGNYALQFNGPYTSVSCAGKDFLVTVYASSPYAGQEAHIPCGNFSTTLDFVLAPP
jgi:hypothetical protein